jgi:hypothetical protein
MNLDPKTFVQESWIKEVFTTPDTPLRTHRITLSYSKFSSYLDSTLFDDQSVAKQLERERTPAFSNANWFHFATWGTYTLGPNIRNDSAPQRLDSLPKTLRRRFTPGIVHSRAADGQVVGRALAWGQEMIFLSAASALLHFKKQVDRRSVMDRPFTMPAGMRDQILARLNWDGEQWVDAGHLTLMDNAFDCYRLVLRRVRELTAAGKQNLIGGDPFIPKLMLLATCLFTAAEQGVADRALAVVIESVPIRLLAGMERQVAKLVQRQQDVPSQVVAIRLLTRLNQVRTPLFDAWARLMTDQLLVMVLPTEMLRLGRDIPLRNAISPMYPASLRNLQVNQNALRTAVPAGDIDSIKSRLVQLWDFVAMFDRTSSGRGSGARDWRRFDDRLNWATALIRSRQQDPTLFWPVYSVEDTGRIRTGELPRATGHPAQSSVSPPLDPQSTIDFLTP